MGLTGALCARLRPETEKKMKHTVRSLVRGAVFAALYAVLTFLQNLLLPGTTSAAIQFRLSEALCIFALFTPDAIWGLTLGCFLFNLLVPGSLPFQTCRRHSCKQCIPAEDRRSRSHRNRS